MSDNSRPGAVGGGEKPGGLDTTYLVKTEVAALLRKKPKTIERWMAAGIIPYIKIGKGRRAPVLFKREVIEATLDANFGVGGEI